MDSISSVWAAAVVVICACGPSLDVDEDGGGGSTAADAGPIDASTGGDAASTGTASSGPTSSSSGVDPDGDTGSEGEGSSGGASAEDRCEATGSLALSIAASGLESYEGRRVWVAAAQPSDLGDASDEIVVILHAVVTDGGFEVECPLGLDENSNYPSLGVVLDADGDGGCSDTDVAFSLQWFAWFEDQVFAIEGDTVLSYETDPPSAVLDNAWTPVAEIGEVWGKPLCDYYLGR